MADVQTVQQQVWKEDFAWLSTYLTETLSRHPDHMSVYVAYADDRAASAAWTYFPQHSQFASLWGGSTISDFRTQGLDSALLAVRAQEARARGMKYLTVDSSPMSRPILEKFGFQLLAYSHPCQWRIKSRE